MRTLVLTIFVAIYSVFVIKGLTPEKLHQDCHVPHLTNRYQNSIYNLIIPLYKSVALQSNANFVFGLDTVWIMLAAIAEGCNKKARHQLFKILKLPHDSCIREKFYKIATTRACLNKDVFITNTRNLFIDEDVTINPRWLEFVSKNSLLYVGKAPIKFTETQTTKAMVNNVPGLNMTGNSVMFDSIYYSGLSTAFTGAVVERCPFYNQAGEEIGSVDLMRVKRRAKMGYIRSLNAKVLELPVGKNGLYRMFLVKFLDGRSLRTVITEIKPNDVMEMFNSLKESNFPFEIAVPRIEMTAQVDLRMVLEGLGVKSIWTDPKYTKFISTPPAFPSSYVQRASVSINEKGLKELLTERVLTSKSSLGLDPEVGTNFIANQPFLLGLFDTATNTPLIAVGFTKPTYPKNY